MTEEQPTDSGRQERVLGSFASLLSSASTTNDETPESLGAASSNLQRFISSTVSAETDCFSIPCLMLKHSDSDLQSTASSTLEEMAALYLSRPLILTREELEELPAALLGNLSETFMSLVDSRLRSSLQALMQQPDAQQESSTTQNVIGLLATAECPILPTTVVTTFRILPACERTHTGDHVAPLIMETVVDLSIINELVTITFVAPGTIQGSFCSPDCLLTRVVVVIDTEALLRSMMLQARSAVREAIAIACGVACNLHINSPDESDDSSTARDTQDDLPHHSDMDSNNMDDGEERLELPRGDNTENENDGANAMLSVPSQSPLDVRGDDTPELPPEDQAASNNQDQVDEFDEQGQLKTDSGLSLLTAAVDGMESSIFSASDESRTGNSMQPRNVVSTSSGLQWFGL